MKTMKKLASMLMAVIMMLSLTVTAFAAEPTGSITIKDSETVSVAGKTFAAYKVMDATFVDVNDVKKGVAYTVPTELADFYATRYNLNKASATFDEKVTEAIAKEADLNAFAKAVLAAAKKAGVKPARATAGDGVTSVKIDKLNLGYYVIEDEGAATPISALVLDTTTKNVTVTIKADKPAIDKKIDGKNDTDPSTNGKVESNNAAIGDKVPYILTSKVPDMTGYEKYFYVVNDTLSKGLTFNDDVTITIGEKTLVKGDDFTVESVKQSSGETTVKIVFKNFIQYKAQKNDAIVIKYSATLNDNAVLGTAGNPNKVNLEYSHNPNITPNGENEPGPDDEGKDITGTTPDEITKTFVTGIKIIKVDEKGNRLEGAEFELTGTRLNTVLVKKDVFTKNSEGTYYKLKDGTYTKTAPSDETTDKYESTTDKYVLETNVETIEKAEEVHYKGVVGSDGVLRFDGLAAGEYVITELKAPDGYNLIKTPIKVTITCNLPENGEGNCTWEVTEPGKVVDGIVELTVVNKTGTELPSTGGMGTTMFYVIGGILVALAAVLMIVRKRMSLER